MALSKISSDDVKDLKSELENIKENDLNKASKLDIIKKTNKDLMDIFAAPEKYAINDQESDFIEVKKILEERKLRLEKKETINRKDDINKFFGELKNPDTWADIWAPEKKKIEDGTTTLYDDMTIKSYIKNLPPIKDFRTKIRKDPKYKIKDIEAKKIKEISENHITDIAKELKANDHFKWLGLSNEMQTKITELMVLFSWLDKFNEAKTNKKNQLNEANKILKKIRKTLNELQTHESLNKTINLVDKRIKNIGGIETTDPKEIGIDAPGKNWISSIPYPLKEHFLDPAKWLKEEPEWYEMKELKLKDKSGKDIEIFEDIAWTKTFDKVLKKWQNADIFFRDGASIKKFANIEITDTPNSLLVLNIESYMDLPSDMFPTNFECSMTGIGWNWSTIENKVGITKQLKGKLDKPDFTPEYTSLDGKYDIKNKLDQIFQETYTAQLRDRFYDFMESDERTKWERARMSSDEKNHFFQDTIMKNTNPSRLSAGIYSMITDVNQANCYGNMDFADDFQKWILEIFTGKTEADLKKLIFEKLGNLNFTELNPTYAIKVLGDKITEKYTTHNEWLYEALNAYLLGTRNNWMKVTPEKLHDGSLASVKEIKAVVADSKEISREDAYKNALKKIEDQYKSGVKFGFKRAKIFFFREKMLRDLIAKEMKGKWGLNMDDPTNSAVNRWATEKSMGGSFAENIIDVEKDTKEKIFDDPIFQQELDATVVDYLASSSADAETVFKTQIEELINNNDELRNYMKKNNITHLGTNIIEQTKAEKAERNYYTSVIGTIDKYMKNGILNKPQEFDVDIRKNLELFIKQQNKLPDMVKHLWLNIDKIDFATKLATHRTTLETMRTRTVKMRLSLLVNKSEEEKWLTTAQYVNQDKFDVKHATKFTKRMNKHPRWTTGATALWLVGTGVVGALTMPVIGVAWWAGILWYLNFLKKKGHYTQEHKKFEETIIAMTPDQRKAYLEDLKEHSEKRPKFIRRAFPTTYSKYGESMEYFNNADSVDSVSKKIQKYLEKSWPLTPVEKKAFQRNLVDAITLLQAHKEKGRNFMYGKEGNTKIEELYNELYSLILAGVTRYNPLAKNPETVVAKILSSVKTSKKVDENMNEYDEDYKKMRQMRNKLWIFAGTRSAAIYIGSAYAAGWIKNQVVDWWNNIFGTDSTSAPVTTTPTTTTTTTPGTTPTSMLPWWPTMVLDPAFGPNGQDLLNSSIFNGDVTKFNAFVAKVQTIPSGSHSEKLRLIFKDMYGTDALANSKTHDFFNLFADKVTEMPLSAQQELIKLWTNFNLHSAPQIADLMTSRWYQGIVTNQADINTLIAWFKSGAIDLNHLPVWWTKETACNVLFCNAQGEQLTDLIFDKVSLLPPVQPGLPPLLPPIDPGIIPPPVQPDIPQAHQRNDNFLSFWVPTVWNEVNKFNKNETTTVTRDDEE